MSHFSVLVIGDDVESALAPFQENNNGDCFKEYLAFGETPPEDGGKVDARENPNARWDWWRIGGRFSGGLMVRGGALADSATLGEVDWDALRKHREAKRSKWWTEAQGKPAVERDLCYGITADMTREQYIAKAARFAPFAVVKDGKWYEKGRMGWWACVSDEKPAATWEDEVAALLADLPPTTRLTIVDCHI